MTLLAQVREETPNMNMPNVMSIISFRWVEGPCMDFWEGRFAGNGFLSIATCLGEPRSFIQETCHQSVNNLPPHANPRIGAWRMLLD